MELSTTIPTEHVLDIELMGPSIQVPSLIVIESLVGEDKELTLLLISLTRCLRTKAGNVYFVVGTSPSSNGDWMWITITTPGK